MRILIGMTGASGAIYGIMLLKELKLQGVETHLTISSWAQKTIEYETNVSIKEVAALASRCYDEKDLSAPIASGSFCSEGMVVLPCSMKTLAGIASGYADNLIARAADVTLKEKRKLVLVPRETPLNTIHLENMLKLARTGAVILPPVPAFYHHPKTIDELLMHTIARILDQFAIEHNFARWQGMLV